MKKYRLDLVGTYHAWLVDANSPEHAVKLWAQGEPVTWWSAWLDVLVDGSVRRFRVDAKCEQITVTEVAHPSTKTCDTNEYDLASR